MATEPDAPGRRADFLSRLTAAEDRQDAAAMPAAQAVADLCHAAAELRAAAADLRAATAALARLLNSSDDHQPV